MSEHLINRNEERQAFAKLLARKRPSLALVTGRRRVGKTYLLANCWEPGDAVLFTASRTTDELNRRELLRELAKWTSTEIFLDDYPTWRSIFRFMLEIADERAASDGRNTIVILDEFQYLGEDERGLAEVASELNAVWERSDASRPPILLVLAGSAVATMESLAAGGGPLYGRFAMQATLQPFTYWHAAELAPMSSLRENASVYGAFGGTPRYLAAIDTSRSFAENMTELLLSPRGEVRLLVETALSQEEGLRDVHRYAAILRAVADGCTARNEIAQRTGLANDQGLRDKIAKLVELGYLELRGNFDAKANEPVQHAVADPAFRFYHRFVVPNLSMLERHPSAEVWSSSVAPHFNGYMGLEFERIARESYDRLSPNTQMRPLRNTSNAAMP